jgi:putative ABC transport system permease protein
MSMIRSHLKLAVRNLRRRPGYTAINVFGLAVGMACCLLILTYARSEWAYDQFHEDADRIHRMNIRAVTPGDDVEIKAGQPLPLARTLTESFPEITAATSMIASPSMQVVVGTESQRHDALFVEPGFFAVFSFPLLAGDPARALAEPGSAVVSRTTAENIWGHTNAVGETLRIRNGDSFQEFRVTGVVADAPANSSIQYDLLLPLQDHGTWMRYADAWTSWLSNTFFRLAPDATLESVHARLPSFAATNYAPMIQTWQILQWIGEDEADFGLVTQSLTDIHFTPDVLQSQTPTTDPRWPGFLLGLALAVLGVACINFTTLSIGRASRRAREVGMRKALGAGRVQLMRQFWGEAILLSVLAVVAALAMAELAVPLFSSLVGVPIALEYSMTGILWLAGLALLTGLLAGAWPAVFLSGFRPITVLKGGPLSGGNARWMQALVVVQFTLSIGFIMAVMVVQAQVSFMQEADLGFRKDRVLVVETMTSDVQESDRRVGVLKEAWRSIPGVQHIAASSSGMNKFLSWGAFGSRGGEAHTIYTNRIDRDWLTTLEVDVMEGQAFTSAFPGNDTSYVLVNEALVREFGWENPIGERVNNYGQVAGVVQDYHFQSLHSAVEPMLLTLADRGNSPFRYLFVRLASQAPQASASTSQSTQNVLAALESAWRAEVPDSPFTWTFLEDDLNVQYATERRAQRLMGAAAGLAVLIACLGLFGLAAYAAERRTREIGIRKVVGAGTFSIVRLLSLEFIGLTTVAVLLAVPLAWIQMERWLDGFAYRTEIEWSTPLAAGLLALGVALATVSWHAVRAAHADPVRSLRHE